ncbi:MAG: T9SS type A sorting domain-containing protein [Chitinophagaceae bacterium]|nr:T9SS type A sorting domain-containing protein [Chitinophagaceae bacterium]
MKRIFLFLICFAPFLTQAQTQKLNGQSGAPRSVNLSDPNIIDFAPGLLHLDQHPIPSAEYGNKKQELIRLQELRRQEAKPTPPLQKKRGVAPNPIIFKGFQGNTANGVPNDNDVAISNGGFGVSVVNANIRVFDDTGTTIVNKSLTSLVAQIGTFSWISDPRVIYDPVADRFALVCFSGALSTSSTIIVGFTQTNDPAGNWNFYTLNGNSFNDSTWSDYPIIAISDKDLFITFNQVKDNIDWTIGFKQSVIWQINKQDGYNATPLNYTLWSGIDYNGKPLRNICPAKFQTTPMGNNLYFLTLRNVDASNDSIFLTEITDSYISGNATLNTKVLIAPVNYGFPPNVRQKKPNSGPYQYLMTNDARVLAAIYENDQVHFGSNTLNPTYLNAGVYLGTIKDVSTATPTVTADIFSSDSMEFGYPSMTYQGTSPADHRILYTFSHCYTDSFPGTSVLYRNAAGDYSDIIQLKNGTSMINVLSDSVERWGDYTNIQKKYNNPGRAYLSGSWGKSGAMNCWLGIIDNADAPVGITPVAGISKSIVYPNPVAEKRFTLRFYNDETRMLKFEIFDLQGRRTALILDTRVKQGENEFSFETGVLSPGQYIFRISDDKETLSSHKITVE